MADTTEVLMERLIGYKTGEMVSLMIHLGLNLGIYRDMAGRGMLDVDTLATGTGLHRRWLLEWLRQQTAAGIIEHGSEETFLLPDEVAELMLDDGSMNYLAGFFHPPIGGVTLDRLADAFRSGVGMSWDDHGATGTHLVAGTTGAAHRRLVTDILPMMDGVVDKLSAGADVIDVGCGSGVAITELAKAYPASRFLGIDPSPTALAEAAACAKNAGVQNLDLREGVGEALEDKAKYDFVMVLDCMHDMTHPNEAMAAIRRAIKDDGAWLVKDIRSADSLAGNLENPMAPLLYGISIAFCMSSAMSTPDGAGLGTMGFSAETAEEMSRQAGFTRFRMLDYEEDLMNAFYEVRP